MSNATELLKRALDALEKWYVHPNEAKVMADIRAHLAAPEPASGAVQAVPAPKKEEIRWLEIGKAMERACGVLPTDFEISIDLERGAGVVNLFSPPFGDDESGEVRNDFENDTFAGQINAAVDAALATAASAGG